MITWIPYTGYGTVEQREKPPRNESFTQRDLSRLIANLSTLIWLILSQIESTYNCVCIHIIVVHIRLLVLSDYSNLLGSEQIAILPAFQSQKVCRFAEGVT